MFWATKVRKLVLISTISESVTEANKEAQEVILDRVACIQYPVQFRKNKRAAIQVLINLYSKVNVMTPAYAKQLDLQVQKTDVGAQKIDNSLFKTFEMVIASFQVEDKLDKAQFF